MTNIHFNMNAIFQKYKDIFKPKYPQTRKFPDESSDDSIKIDDTPKYKKRRKVKFLSVDYKLPIKDPTPVQIKAQIVPQKDNNYLNDTKYFFKLKNQKFLRNLDRKRYSMIRPTKIQKIENNKSLNIIQDINSIDSNSNEKPSSIVNRYFEIVKKHRSIYTQNLEKNKFKERYNNWSIKKKEFSLDEETQRIIKDFRSKSKNSLKKVDFIFKNIAKPHKKDFFHSNKMRKARLPKLNCLKKDLIKFHF